jgi:hypothetical protein
MTYHPTPEEIQHIMEITGMDYIQARNHLIGRQLVQQAAVARAAANLARLIDNEVMNNARKAQS